MQLETRLGRLIEYTTIVASTMEGIAQTHKVPLLSPTATLSREILHMMEAGALCLSPLILELNCIE
jgi:hypothetical protein